MSGTQAPESGRSRTWTALPAALLASLCAACGGSEAARPAGGEVDPALVKMMDERDAAQLEGRRREAELLGEIEDLKRERDGLAAERDACQQELGVASADAQRFEEGLGRAVGELNRVAAAPTPAPPQAAPAERQRGRARVTTLGAPEVQVIDRIVNVSGRIWNAGESDASGTLIVELVFNGRVIDQAEQPLELSARTDGSYFQSFTITPRDGTLGARVRLDY